MFNNFADRLYVLRRLRGLSAGEAAEKIGVTRSILSSWERGHVKPHMSSALLIAEGLNCSLDWLYGKAPIDAVEGAEND